MGNGTKMWAHCHFIIKLASLAIICVYCIQWSLTHYYIAQIVVRVETIYIASKLYTLVTLPDTWHSYWNHMREVHCVHCKLCSYITTLLYIEKWKAEQPDTYNVNTALLATSICVQHHVGQRWVRVLIFTCTSKLKHRTHIEIPVVDSEIWSIWRNSHISWKWVI